ncbi:hypothetical protein Hanom_Chr08g00731971 [Helianthus anomalus]
MSSKVCIVRSLWPSVCGWNAVLRFNCEPKASWKDCHILDTNRPSLSEMIERGTPCRATISLKKCADFVRRSTITQIISWPLGVLGSFVTKSIEICSHFHLGISGCCRSPEGFWYSALTLAHVKHLLT